MEITRRRRARCSSLGTSREDAGHLGEFPSECPAHSGVGRSGSVARQHAGHDADIGQLRRAERRRAGVQLRLLEFRSEGPGHDVVDDARAEIAGGHRRSFDGDGQHAAGECGVCEAAAILDECPCRAAAARWRRRSRLYRTARGARMAGTPGRPIARCAHPLAFSAAAACGAATIHGFRPRSVDGSRSGAAGRTHRSRAPRILDDRSPDGVGSPGSYSARQRRGRDLPRCRQEGRDGAGIRRILECVSPSCPGSPRPISTPRCARCSISRHTGWTRGSRRWLTRDSRAFGRRIRREESCSGPMDGSRTCVRQTPQAASAGFIHAPSLNQATTAAIMCAGYLAHSDATQRPFEIDLSSDKVRLAMHLLDGIRQGQPLVRCSDIVWNVRCTI